MIIRKNILPRSIIDALVTTFVFAIIPIVYYFELFIVLPKYYIEWGTWYIFHFILGTFLLFNVCSNLISVMICDTSIKGRLIQHTGSMQSWKFCSVCETITPPRSWHCNTCNVCILKRDHHCYFTSYCIGHNNQRYFLMLVFHIFISTAYASFYNLHFIMNYIDLSSWISIIKVIFPLATLFLKWSLNQVYIFLVIIVVIGCIFTSVLFYFHVNLMLKGMITPERNQKMSEYDEGKIQNVINVLGKKWYMVWMSPFIQSELPQDGIHWDCKKSQKAK